MTTGCATPGPDLRESVSGMTTGRVAHDIPYDLAKEPKREPVLLCLNNDIISASFAELRMQNAQTGETHR